MARLTEYGLVGGIQVKNGRHKGRLVLPGYAITTRRIEQHYAAGAGTMFSDDGGAHWRVGTLMLKNEQFGGVGYDEGMTMGKQLGVQCFAAVATAIYAAVASFIILKVVAAVVGLRVSEAEENEGLDLAYHGEEAYND